MIMLCRTRYSVCVLLCPDVLQRVVSCPGVFWCVPCYNVCFFFVLLTVHLSISLDNDQLDAHLHYFTIRPLQSFTCFEHYMLIIRRLHCIDAASGIVLSVSGCPVHGWERTNLQFSLNLCTVRPLTERTIPDAASIQCNPLMMSM